MLTDDKEYHVHFGDCIEHMQDMDEASMDFSVFSPPFPSLFSYTSSMADLGNNERLDGEVKLHLSFFFKALARVMKPGRVVMVHCMQIPRLLRNGSPGTFDYRGLNIRVAQRCGFIYQYDWLVQKNPQSQAIRTHSHNLLFVTLERDRAITRGALGDYLIKFVREGENKTPIDSSGEISRQDWIDWAEASWHWHDIHESDTLNVKEGRGDDDTRHICPLQLKVIERLELLYSNPGEIVFSPFAGIGSEGYMALKLGRRFYGCELKEEYYKAMLTNLDRAIEARKYEQAGLFLEVAEA